jgi:hypothetical protein
MDARAKTVRDRAREAERYREAAELTLDQLAWCVDLYRIRKPTLANGLKANREHLMARFRDIA